MRKKRIILVDTFTSILLLIEFQSIITFVIKKWDRLQSYQWDRFSLFYYNHGIRGTILDSSFEKLYFWIVTITFFLNLYIIVVKLKDIQKKKLVRGIYRGFIVFNLIFVVLKALEFYIHLIILMHA